MSEQEQDDIDRKLLEEAGLGRLESVGALLQAGADPNRRYFVDNADESSTAMVKAARHAHRECFEALLAAGGRFDVMTSHGVTPLHAAVAGRHEEFGIWMAKLPQAMEAAPRINVHQLLKDCCLFGLPKMLKALLDLGYLKVVTPEELDPLLAEAGLIRRVECFQTLYEFGRKSGLEDRLDTYGAFFQSAGDSDAHLDFMRWMLENTTLPKQLAVKPGENVKTLLSWNHPRVVQALVDGGCLPRPDAEVLADALVQAVRDDHLGSVKLLLEWDADLHPRFEKQSLLQLARKDPMRRLLRAARSHRLMESAMGGEEAAAPATRREPGML